MGVEPIPAVTARPVEPLEVSVTDEYYLHRPAAFSYEKIVGGRLSRVPDFRIVVSRGTRGARDHFGDSEAGLG